MCSIIGVHGARILDDVILREITNSIDLLIGSVTNNQSYSKIFNKVCNEGIKDVKEIHFLMKNKEAIKLLNLFNSHALRIGAFVQFRKILKQALNKVCDERAPFNKQTIEIIQRTMNVKDTDCEQKDDEVTLCLNQMMNALQSTMKEL